MSIHAPLVTEPSVMSIAVSVCGEIEGGVGEYGAVLLAILSAVASGSAKPPLL